MKKAKLIYNPFSGDGSFKFELDACISAMQKGGFEVHPFRSIEIFDIPKHLSEIDKDYYDVIIVSGGDGSINIVVNSMVKYNIDVPLGIIPSGTANDFASYLQINIEPEEAIKTILRNRIMETDIGFINDKCFINVCCIGLWANVSSDINTNFKNSLGKVAYYVKGIEQLQGFSTFPVKITTSDAVIREKIYMILCLNSSGTGGFEKIVPNASVTDGAFDFLVVKEMPFKDLTSLLIRWVKGEVTDHPKVMHIVDNKLKVEVDEEELKKGEIKTIPLYTDVDGEKGPALPVEISVMHKKIKIYIP